MFFSSRHAGFRAGVDEKTIAYPEYRGNGRLASVGNILGNPQIGMIFLDYVQSTVGLHVNGKARVLAPDEITNLPNLPAAMLDATKIKG